MRLPISLAVAAVAAVLAVPGAHAGFAAGQCTTWAYLMRPDIVATASLAGDKITNWNAYAWAANAREAGYSVGTKPAVGAIAVWPKHVLGAGALGHVAYVQKVRSDGSFYISEEDYNGSPNVHRRWVAPTSALQFIYLQPGQHAPSGPMTPGGQLETMTSSGTFRASDPGGTQVAFTLDAATSVAFRLTGPGIDHTVTWRIPGGSRSVTLAQLAAQSTLPAGSYRLTAFAYDTALDGRWVTFSLG